MTTTTLEEQIDRHFEQARGSEGRASGSLRAELQRLLILRDRLKRESLALYVPLPPAAEFHASRRRWRVLDGSNRSGKTLAAAVEAARALCGCDPHKKYPRRGVRALIVGRDGDHLANPMAEKLLRPGAFKLIPDEGTGQLRAVRPHPKDPTRLDDYDEAYRERWVDAPPLIPERMVLKIGWDDKAKGIPRVVQTHCGEALWRSSKGDPPQGGVYHLVWLDEHIVNDMFYVQATRGLTDTKGLGIWSATPEAVNWQLLELRDKARMGLKSVGEWELLIERNPYLSDQQRQEFRESLPDDKVQTHYYGVPAVARSLVYGHIDVMGVHGCEPFAIPSSWTRYIFVDPGRQKAGTLFAAVDPDEKHVYIYEEILLENLDANIWAERVAQRQGGVAFEAVVMDKHAGKRHPEGFTESVAERYMKALAVRGVRPRSLGPLAGAFPGCDDIGAREEAVRDAMRIRAEDFVRGTARLQIFRGRCPLLEKQMRRACLDPRRPGRRKKQEEDILVCLEYGMAFDPYYQEPVLVGEEERPTAWRRLQKKLARRNRAAGEGVTLG